MPFQLTSRAHGPRVKPLGVSTTRDALLCTQCAHISREGHYFAVPHHNFSLLFTLKSSHERSTSFLLRCARSRLISSKNESVQPRTIRKLAKTCHLPPIFARNVLNTAPTPERRRGDVVANHALLCTRSRPAVSTPIDIQQAATFRPACPSRMDTGPLFLVHSSSASAAGAGAPLFAGAAFLAGVPSSLSPALAFQSVFVYLSRFFRIPLLPTSGS